MNKEKNKKIRDGIVYSTNPDFIFEKDANDNSETVTPGEQRLRVMLDRSHRKGKTVTLITGFRGNEEQMKILEKELKTKCASGGSSKNNEIILQGDFRDKISEYLKSKGYKVT